MDAASGFSILKAACVPLRSHRLVPSPRAQSNKPVWCLRQAGEYPVQLWSHPPTTQPRTCTIVADSFDHAIGLGRGLAAASDCIAAPPRGGIRSAGSRLGRSKYQAGWADDWYRAWWRGTDRLEVQDWRIGGESVIVWWRRCRWWRETDRCLWKIPWAARGASRRGCGIVRTGRRVDGKSAIPRGGATTCPDQSGLYNGLKGTVQTKPC